MLSIRLLHVWGDFLVFFWVPLALELQLLFRKSRKENERRKFIARYLLVTFSAAVENHNNFGKIYLWSQILALVLAAVCTVPQKRTTNTL
jgi:hypothetical protein